MTNRMTLLAAMFTLAACSSNGTRPRAVTAEDQKCPTQVRCYSEEDLRRTGRTNAADALPVLDPSITVRRQ